MCPGPTKETNFVGLPPTPTISIIIKLKISVQHMGNGVYNFFKAPPIMLINLALKFEIRFQSLPLYLY